MLTAFFIAADLTREDFHMFVLANREPTSIRRSGYYRSNSMLEWDRAHTLSSLKYCDGLCLAGLADSIASPAYTGVTRT